MKKFSLETFQFLYGMYFYEFFLVSHGFLAPSDSKYYACLKLSKITSTGTLKLELAGIRLGRHDSSPPVLADLLVALTEVVVDSLDEFVQGRLVLSETKNSLTHSLTLLSYGESSSGLSADNGSESSLSLDDGVWNVEFAAEGWEVENNLDWVDIVSDEDQLSSAGFNKAGDGVDSMADSVWALGDFLLLSSSTSLDDPSC
ncbi:Protein CBG26438 [Caenorhabditis briggsae]|uniref:Protein CBG26438 n=1 Tax=Caenorhabditis briggsae TaxID=6238 RepID=B6IEX5_CAEBR|nr:Protein CBG26438 [Caenorhabditis briggsae]CAR98455.1 Protein CBG26438 [Caenorhabditis briggsae]